MIDKIKNNWRSGLTVALVSIPLSISLAVASGATPIQGIITAVWAGLMASIFGGSNFNIIGPAGALSGILSVYALRNGFGVLPVLAVVTGLFIILAYFLRLDKYLIFIPSSAIHGFTLGVAFMIAWGQVNSLLGLRNLPVHEKFLNNFIETVSHLSSASIDSIFIFGIFLAALFVVLKYLPKVPPVIALTPIAMFVGYLNSVKILSLNIINLGDKYASLSGNLIGSFQFKYSNDLVFTALTVSIVAILETMLSAKIADGMTKTKYARRREMLGLGLANIASGILGGLPATGVLARTALNVKSGANDKMSATISSISIAVISILMISYFKYLPMPAIASILFFVSIRMVEIDHFKRMFAFDKKGFLIALLVAGITIFDDPIIGITAGAAISLLILVEKISRGQFDIILNHNKKGIVHTVSGDDLKEINKKGDTLVYSIKGQLVHLNTHSHIARFEGGLNGYKNIVIRLRELYFIDLDGVECISEIIEICTKQKRQIAITGVNEFIERLLRESIEFRHLEDTKLVFNKTSDALKYFGYKIK